MDADDGTKGEHEPKSEMAPPTIGPSQEAGATDREDRGKIAGCFAGLAIGIFPIVLLTLNGSSPSGFGIVSTAPIFLIVGGIVGIGSLASGRNKPAEEEESNDA